MFVLLRLACCASASAVLLAVPAAASAGAGHGTPERPLDAAAARSLVERQVKALEALPPEVRGRCTDTDPVAGLGPACRTADGSFRVVLEGGGSIVTHGSDAPATGETPDAPHLPSSDDALTAASASDIRCVTADTELRVELIYAYPSDRENRVAEVADDIQLALYRSSAFVDAESRAVDPAAGRRIRALCDASGEASVTAVALDPLGTATGQSFSKIVSQLTERGYPVPTWNSTSPRRFMVFYDAPSSSGAAGTGHFYNDDTPGAENLNNKGSRYAVEYAWSSSRLPHWDVFLHEISHNMGAVSDNAPDSSGGAHCNDGLDIMCYSDGGDTSAYVGTVCSVERYDCGSDSYFHPNPALDSFLGRNWNVAATYNGFMHAYDAGGGPADTTPPSSPGELAASATSSSLAVSWTASSDDRSAVTYVAKLDRLVDGSWSAYRSWGPSSALETTFSKLAADAPWRVRVRAIDASGNESAEAVLETRTSALPPAAPEWATLALADATTVDAAWAEVTSGAGLAGYDVELQRWNGDAWALSDSRRVTAATARFEQLDASTSWRVRVRAVDLAGAVGSWRTSAYVTTPRTLTGTTGGTAPPTPRVRGVRRSPSSVALAWTSAGASRWSVRVLDHSGSVVHAVDGLDRPRHVVAGLAPRSFWIIRVWAHGADGTSSGVRAVRVRTLPDRAAPGRVRLAGAPLTTAGVTRVAWRAAPDNVAVERYQVQRLIWGRWRTIFSRPGSQLGVSVRHPARAHQLRLRVRAVDAAGNAGRWTGILVRRR